MEHEHNCLNINFISSLLEDINHAFKARDDIRHDIILNKWGVHDDYIYCEYFNHYFDDALPCERKAIMRIVREVINASAEAYYELIKEGYYSYEEYNKEDYSLDEIAEKLAVKFAENDD